MNLRRILLGLLFCLLNGCGNTDNEPSVDRHSAVTTNATGASQLRMAKRLSKYQSSVFDSDPFLSTARIREGRLALLQGFPQNKDREMQTRLFLAESLLRHGSIRSALEQYESVQTIAETLGRRLTDSTRARLELFHGIAFLRLAEQENCLDCTDGSACILPIAETAIHQKKDPATQAIRHFKNAIELDSSLHNAHWLLCVSAMTLGAYSAEVPTGSQIKLPLSGSLSPVGQFRNSARERNIDSMSLAGGAVADDFDNDGDLDLFVTDWDTKTTPKLFLNDGLGHFEDASAGTGLQSSKTSEGITGGLNAVQADFDNDGDIDVYVLRGAWKGDLGLVANSLLRNEGDGRFLDVTYKFGLGDHEFPTQTAAWGDFDLDGDLDLYVGNESYPSQLYRNDGSRFVDVAKEAGVLNQRFAKGVVWGDYDSDGYPDLYVSNDQGDNRLYHNNRDGTFTDKANEVGVTGPQSSFPCWFFDFNNDGALDLFVASYPMDMNEFARQMRGLPTNAENDRLYQGDGSGGFTEVASQMGIDRVTDVMGSNFGDLNNDGFLDFCLGTGAPGLEFLQPNLMYLNLDGQRFKEIAFDAGFAHLQKGHAVAFADFDNDGDQDVFQQMGGAYPGDPFRDVFYENPGNGNSWLKVDLVGTQSNRDGIGSRIKLIFHDKNRNRQVFRWVNSGGSFGANPLTQHFGCGSAKRVERVEVYWPRTGKTQIVRSIAVNQTLKIIEGTEQQ